ERPHRFGELHRRLDGVSKKVLAETLRALERDGVLEHRDDAAYALTALGATLHEPLRALQVWAESHIETVLANRDRYDELEDQQVLERIGRIPPNGGTDASLGLGA